MYKCKYRTGSFRVLRYCVIECAAESYLEPIDQGSFIRLDFVSDKLGNSGCEKGGRMWWWSHNSCSPIYNSGTFWVSSDDACD